MSFRVIQCHSLSSLPVTKLSCSLQLRLLDGSLSLSHDIPPYFSGLQFPTMALYFFCDRSQKMTPPPPPSGAKIISIPVARTSVQMWPLPSGGWVAGLFLSSPRWCSSTVSGSVGWFPCSRIHHQLSVPKPPPPPLCDIPSSCCFFTGPRTVTRSSLHMLRWVAAF